MVTKTMVTIREAWNVRESHRVQKYGVLLLKL